MQTVPTGRLLCHQSLQASHLGTPGCCRSCLAACPSPASPAEPRAPSACLVERGHLCGLGARSVWKRAAPLSPALELFADST